MDPEIAQKMEMNFKCGTEAHTSISVLPSQAPNGKETFGAIVEAQ